MRARAFIDTNVLVYAVDQAATAKRERALAVLGTVNPVLSAQVLSEFYWTVTRKLKRPLPADEARRQVGELARMIVMPITAPLVQAAIQTSQDHQLAYWDALIVEAAVTAGCKELLSEDLADGSVLRGVRVRNPFA
jgi:predicted nucleic acid-binding protein